MSSNKSFNRIIISLDNIPEDARQELRQNFQLIDEEDPYVIWEKWRYKTINGTANNHSIQNVFALETFLFINYLKRHGARDIEIFSDQELFLYNDNLYRIKNNKIIREDLENTGFFGVRPINWHYPFFQLLEDLITAKGGCFCKTNFVKGARPVFKGKFFAMKDLYPQRQKFLGSLLIPYKVQNYALLFDFVEEQMGERIIVKKDNTQGGLGVVPINTSYQDGFEKFVRIMRTHMKYQQEVYILPYYDFSIEYRVYFTKFDDEIILHSIKTKQVSEKYGDIFTKENFEYYKNVHLDWDYVPKKEWPRELIDISLDYIQAMHYSTGSLEFGITTDKQYIFFEVNSMSDPILYAGEDMQDMQHYYELLFDKITQGIS